MKTDNKKAKKQDKKVSSKKVVKPSVPKTQNVKKPVEETKKVDDTAKKLHYALKDIEGYKMAVGQLEALVDQLKLKNQKAKKQIASLQDKLAKCKESIPVQSPIASDNNSSRIIVPGNFAVPPPVSPFKIPEVSTEPSQGTPKLSILPSPDHSYIPPTDSDFLKNCKAVRY